MNLANVGDTGDLEWIRLSSPKITLLIKEKTYLIHLKIFYMRNDTFCARGLEGHETAEFSASGTDGEEDSLIEEPAEGSDAPAIASNSGMAVLHTIEPIFTFQRMKRKAPEIENRLTLMSKPQLISNSCRV